MVDVPHMMWILIVVIVTSSVPTRGFLRAGTPAVPDDAAVRKGLRIESSEKTIQPGVTQYFSVNCSLNTENMTNVRAVVSLVVSKFNEGDKDSTEFAHITMVDPEKVIADVMTSATVKGHLDKGYISYISLEWKNYPGEEVAGNYVCKAHVVSNTVEFIEVGLKVDIEKADMSVFANSLMAILKKTESQQRTIESMNKTISSMGSTINAMKMTMIRNNKTINSMGSTINAMNMTMIRNNKTINSMGSTINAMNMTMIRSNKAMLMVTGDAYLYHSDSDGRDVIYGTGDVFKTIDEAQKSCAEWGGKLIEMDQAGLNSLYTHLVARGFPDEFYWLGWNNKNGTWVFASSNKQIGNVLWNAIPKSDESCALYHLNGTGPENRMYGHSCTHERQHPALCTVKM